MKKQLRLVLFAMLIAILVVMAAIGVSAETTDADEIANGNYYKVVSDTDGTVLGYYATLADAVGAIQADGYTVTVLSDVTESAAITLSNAHAYSISGGEQGATITFSNTSTNGPITLTAGSVTFDNVTVATTVSVKYLFYANGASALTLNDFKTSVAASDNTVYANKAVALTVSGTKTDISGAVKGFFNAVKAANGTVTVTGGKIASGGYIIMLQSAMTVNITGGELIGGNDAMFRHNSSRASVDGSAISITALVRVGYNRL